MQSLGLGVAAGQKTAQGAVALLLVALQLLLEVDHDSVVVIEGLWFGLRVLLQQNSHFLFALG